LPYSAYGSSYSMEGFDLLKQHLAKLIGSCYDHSSIPLISSYNLKKYGELTLLFPFNAVIKEIE